jgi:hypothetical protein
VLIEAQQHDVVMLGFVLVSLLLIIGPLALVAGVDSRVDERTRRRLGH